MESRDTPKDQIIYPAFERLILGIVGWTVYGTWRTQVPGLTRRGVERYIIGWQVISYGLLVLVTRVHLNDLVAVFVAFLCIIRAIEVISTLLRHYFLWAPERLDIDRMAILSARRSLLLLLLNYGELIVLFAVAYVLAFHYALITFKPGETYEHAGWLLLHESLIGMVGNTTGLVIANSRVGWALFLAQPCCGFLVISVVLGQVLSGFPRPRSLHPDEIEKP